MFTRYMLGSGLALEKFVVRIFSQWRCGARAVVVLAPGREGGGECETTSSALDTLICLLDGKVGIRSPRALKPFNPKPVPVKSLKLKHRNSV
jgi:hypothetical protein